ncbi:ATPase involved in DNA repair [Nostoc flagelliforme CCNUN1]|uniref:ATPase involved in DNA repair n=1 Tax=Nostoc flagelliforme CCNUN1 TaxID=2038116 RepID=A0A2K8SFR6_9NOSO|nr:hypothetical protein [Nostoc flagelliforme]AUB34302.1 ATPase involved in DNA repair [Nostoc flagelliforme CCNUN1]
MARRKRNSTLLERADRRIESLQSISVELDFGQGLTMQAYNMTINDLRSKLAAYNTADRQSICRATANPEESLLVRLLVDLERHGLVIPLSKKLLPSPRKYLKILLNCL